MKMIVEGFITQCEEHIDTDPTGKVHDVMRTVTFVFKNGRAGTVVTLPWDGPLPDVETLGQAVWTLMLTPVADKEITDHDQG